MYLVDTNVLSEICRRSPEAIQWVKSVPPALLRVSVISLGEIMRGIAAKQKTDAQTADRLSQWLSTIRSEYADRVEIIDDRVAMEWGRLAIKRSRGEADGLIAATAIVRDFVVVTRNVADFVDLPLTVLNPWDAKSR